MASKGKYIKKSDSKDALRFFTWNRDQATVYPDFSLQACVDMIDNDPVARGALNHFVDKCMEGDYNIVKRDTNELDTATEKSLNSKYQFRTEIIRKIFLLGNL